MRSLFEPLKRCLEGSRTLDSGVLGQGGLPDYVGIMGREERDLLVFRLGEDGKSLARRILALRAERAKLEQAMIAETNRAEKDEFLEEVTR